MIVPMLALGLCGLAAASPVTSKRQATPHYPETSASNGFHLVVNVTDASKDFTPPIQNTYVASIHVGAGLALVGNIASTKNARVFYQNGTADERHSGETTVITDSGTPYFPSGIKLVQDKASDKVSTAHLDAGPGTDGIGLAGLSNPYVFLKPETWLACNESIPYYQNKYFIVFKQANSSDVPKDCAHVRLVPECTKLNDLPTGSYSSHEFAIEDRCYRDVKSIKWSNHS